jgi:HEAT repeat protein
MANSATQDINATLDSLYTAERNTRELTTKLLAAQPASVLEAIRSAIGSIASLSSMDEQVLRLVCLARVLNNIPGPDAIDALIDILGHEEEEVRMEAGTILDNLATERFDDLQSGVERAAKRLPAGNLALQELPFVLMGVLSDSDPKPLLKPFLEHKDPEAVAAAIEVISELGDPSVLPLLEKLRKDKRTVEIEDDSTDETSSVAIGELAVDAINGLKEIEKAMRAGSGR